MCLMYCSFQSFSKIRLIGKFKKNDFKVSILVDDSQRIRIGIESASTCIAFMGVIRSEQRQIGQIRSTLLYVAPKPEIVKQYFPLSHMVNGNPST